MNKLLSILLLIVIATTTYSQILYPDIMEFGVNTAVEYTGSGHGSNLTVNMVAFNDYKSFEIGAIFKEDASRLKGANLKFKSFVGRYNYYFGNTLIKPYVVYNCLYQTEYVFVPVMIKTPTETIIIEDQQGGYISTLEHYLGTGLMFRFLNNFYVDSTIGFGVYFGSLDKTKAPNKLGFHDVNHGYTANLKIGVGYILR